MNGKRTMREGEEAKRETKGSIRRVKEGKEKLTERDSECAHTDMSHRHYHKKDTHILSHSIAYAVNTQ